MSVYTITVTLTPEEDAALRAQAARSGQTAEELLRRSVRIPAAPDQATRPDNALQKEYHRRARRVSGTKPPLDRVWQELADAPPLSTAAAVHRGIKYAHFDAAEPRFVSPAEKAGFVPGVWDGRNNVGPYIPRSHGYLTAEGPLRRRAAWDWSAPKVIAPATRVSTGPWIMAVMVDYVGLLCTQRFHGIWRRDIPAAPPLEVLAAALNGPVANAWIASLAAKRDVPIHSLLSLPLPPLSPLTTELITRYVDRYIGRGGEPETLLKIDAAVLDAYGLSAEAERELLASFVGARRPGVPGFTGYGPDFERARAEYRHERALAELGARHQALVEKSFLGGLTPQEAQEKERLRQEIDQDSTPLFGTTRQETSPTDSEALLHEYHDLVDLELVGHLTEEQTIRLQEIKDALDEMDAQDPVEQAIDARVRETSDRLDAILNELRRQPLKPVGP